MKTIKLLLSAALLGTGMVAAAQTVATDTAKTVVLKDVEVLGTRAESNTPIAFTNISKAEIEAVNHGQDLPFLLSTTPACSLPATLAQVWATRAFACVVPMPPASTSPPTTSR